MGERKLIRENDEFPSNSNKSKEQAEVAEPKTEKKVDRVVSGNVIRAKKTFGQKASEMFFGDDTHSVVDYILNDILIPAFKSTVSDMVNGGIEMLLFGERRSSSGASKIYRDRSRSYVPYNRISREDDRRSLSRSARTNHDFDQITIESRGEAEDVLSHLVDLIEDYEVASVADYYDLLGIESKFTDSKYGWTNVRDAYVERVRNGYSIHLPRPREI